jgi:hypothetical protein
VQTDVIVELRREAEVGSDVEVGRVVRGRWEGKWEVGKEVGSGKGNGGWEE